MCIIVEVCWYAKYQREGCDSELKIMNVIHACVMSEYSVPSNALNWFCTGLHILLTPLLQLKSILY